MSAREIFATRRRQPEKPPVDKGRHGWSYHEGSFFPLEVVLRFLAFAEQSLTRLQFMAASNSPEEWWLFGGSSA